MTVTHPLALRDGGSVPGAYTFGAETYQVYENGDIACPDGLETEIAEALAGHYGADVDALLGEEPDLEPGDTVCTCEPGEACHRCGGYCPTVKHDGEVCGADRPCSYHDEAE